MSQAAFYVSPEQQVKDRAEFARAGVAKGRSVIVARCAQGILFVSENRSKTLHKVAEIHDRIGFAAVGKYNEFEALRVAGIRLADLRGYSYARKDVTGRMLAGAYAQLLGSIFSAVMEKPYEVEVVVAEVGNTTDEDEIYRLSFDGSIIDEPDFTVIGGASEVVSASLTPICDPQLSLGACLRMLISALAADPRERPPLTVSDLEVALLDRDRTQTRKFRRLSTEEILEISADPPAKPKRRTTRAKPKQPQVAAEESDSEQ